VNRTLLGFDDGPPGTPGPGPAPVPRGGVAALGPGFAPPSCPLPASPEHPQSLPGANLSSLTSHPRRVSGHKQPPLARPGLPEVLVRCQQPPSSLLAPSWAGPAPAPLAPGCPGRGCGCGRGRVFPDPVALAVGPPVCRWCLSRSSASSSCCRAASSRPTSAGVIVSAQKERKGGKGELEHMCVHEEVEEGRSCK